MDGFLMIGDLSCVMEFSHVEFVVAEDRVIFDASD